MPHRNAPLSETGRLRLARCVVEDGWPLRRAAERFQVSPTTARRWADRYRRFGEAGMGDLSSRPHTSPRRTPTRTERRIIKVRVLRRWGPARIAHLLHLTPSTVHRVLTRYGLARLTHLDRATGRAVRRYERDRPGELVHVDVKKLGRIPPGRAGHRVHGQRGLQRSPVKDGKRQVGWEFVHVCVDDATRLAYVEVLDDEKATTAAAFLARAVAFYAAHGITVQRVMTDNGSPYRSTLHTLACRALGLRHLRTRPYRPRTNGKAERFIKTMIAGWNDGAIYGSSRERAAALNGWLWTYNHRRPHGALSHRPPIARLDELNNLAGFYI